MPKKWKLDYFTPSRMETSLHATREDAMTALYHRLDLEQRDALAFGDQKNADYIGRMRGGMASAWHYATRHKVDSRKGGMVWQCDLGRITRA